MGFWFKKKTGEKESFKVLNSLDNLDHFLKSDITSFQQFENDLTKQLKDLKDLEENMRVLAKQIITIKILANQREDLILKLLIEEEKDKKEINVVECSNIKVMIQKIDEHLLPMIETILTEVSKLFLKETRFLGKESDKNKDDMKQLDKEARVLNAEVKRISDYIKTSKSHLDRIFKFLKKIETKRNKVK